MNIGIHSIGIYLPDEVRTNNWWPESVRAQWGTKLDARLDRPAGSTEEVASGVKMLLDAMAEYRNDPFKGAIERRVMPEGMLTSEMELRAAELAIERAGIAREEIGVLLSTSNLPDYLMEPNVCKVHKRLRLRSDCFSLQTDGVCNSWHHHVALAEPMIRTGVAKYALVIQSAATSRLLRPEDPQSAWFGDGAAATILGPVSEGRGILGRAHETDGSYSDGLVCGIPGRRWYEGRPFVYSVSEEATRKIILGAVNQSRTVTKRSLAEAGVAANDVDFYAAHQGLAWIPKATQRLAGLTRARRVDSFPWAGSLLGANIPLVLSVGERDGLLRDGDLVTTFAGATGATISSLTLRWGRA